MTGELHEDGKVKVYARHCVVRRIDKPCASAFLRDNHLYGDAACRYRYGVFLMKDAGPSLPVGTLLAVGTFSPARRILRDGATRRSFEWVRYATPAGIQLMGGMGKVLEAFKSDADPDDIMTYVPESSFAGESYLKLGFAREGEKKFPNGIKSAKLRLILR